MLGKFILSDSVEQAMSRAEYDKLEDGSFAGRIPECKGARESLLLRPHYERVKQNYIPFWKIGCSLA